MEKVETDIVENGLRAGTETISARMTIEAKHHAISAPE